MKSKDVQGHCPRDTIGRHLNGGHFFYFIPPFFWKQFNPPVYYNHWLLPVFSIYTLLQDNIQKADLLHASSCLTRFVVEVQELYGKCYVGLSYNVHCLTHLSNAVDMWGPLWANSSFVYEDTIGTLLEMFNGTQAVPELIFKRFFNTKTLMHHTELFNNASDDVCDLFNKLVNKDNTVLKSYKVGSGARVVGNYTTRVITVGESILFGNDIEASVKEFKRCFIHHTLYTTEMYAANLKRNNSCVALKNGEHGSIKSILLCKLHCGCLSACKCEEVYLQIFWFKKDSRQLRIYDDFAKVNTAKQIVKFRKTHEILLCKPNDILCKCFCYVHDESIILIKMPVLENV